MSSWNNLLFMLCRTLVLDLQLPGGEFWNEVIRNPSRVVLTSRRINAAQAYARVAHVGGEIAAEP